MALPENFSEWELLQSTLMRVHNRNVRDEFSDLGGDDWQPSIGTPRGALRHACTVKDKDTAPMVLNRMFLYYFCLRKAQDLQPPIYGVPVEDYQQTFKFRPQITLAFVENAADVDPDYYPCTGLISFRLMSETSTTITKSELEQKANKIKSVFATPRYRWKKGKDNFSYRDPEKGYQLKILARTESDAKQLISSVLDIQNHTPDWELLRKNEAIEVSSAFPTNPGSQTILGKAKKKPRRRPIADVFFVYADIKIHGLTKAIPLVDTTGRYLEALESV